MLPRPSSTPRRAAGALALLLASCDSFGSAQSVDSVTADAAADAAADGGTGAGADAGHTTYTGPKRIFLTRAEFNADLVSAAKRSGRDAGANGLIAADALCELEAIAILPAGKWHAWISTGGASATAAIARFTDLTSPRVDVSTQETVLPRIGGELVQLVRDVDGKLHPEASRVWTGTTASGQPTPATMNAPSDCGGWTRGDGTDIRGAAGDPNDLKAWSVGFFAEFCQVSARLYCIED